MLSNLLLVLGMCFVAGGYNRIEQNFNMTVAQTAWYCYQTVDLMI